MLIWNVTKHFTSLIIILEEEESDYNFEIQDGEIISQDFSIIETLSNKKATQVAST